MSWYHPSTILDKVFEGGILIKGVTGALEFIGGLLLLFVNPASIHRLLVIATQSEIVEDPHDKLANFLLHTTQHLNVGNKNFAIAYLWIHAAVKLTAVFGILCNQLWA